MANNFGFEIGGLDEFIQEMESKNKNAENIVLEEMTKFGMLAEEGAKALAPHDEGTLEDSINFDKATVEGNDIVVRGGSNSEYALRRHEEPYRTGTHDKYARGRHFPNYYVDGRGKGTRRKPNWRGYEAGRKYLENTVRAIEGRDYQHMMERIMKRILEEN